VTREANQSIIKDYYYKKNTARFKERYNYN